MLEEKRRRYLVPSRAVYAFGGRGILGMMYTQLRNGAEFQFVLWPGELLRIEARNTISEIATIVIKYGAWSSLSRHKCGNGNKTY
jgi:hypothetical protein